MVGVYPRTAVVLPIRSFTDGKTRLGPHLPLHHRAELARSMATGVVRACEELPVVVVTSAPEVVGWARSLDLGVLDDPGSLDAAAWVGIEWARSQLFNRVVIAHADLPYTRTLRPLLTRYADEGLIAVIGHRDCGSPALSLPARTDFAFAYGPGSLRRHIHEAMRLHLPMRLMQDVHLGFDLDTAENLAHLRAWPNGLPGPGHGARRPGELTPDLIRHELSTGDTS